MNVDDLAADLGLRFVTSAAIWKVYAKVQRLAADYPAAYVQWAADAMPSAYPGGDRANKPTSQPPAGRDRAVGGKLLACTHHLARAHLWANFWAWPRLPWMPTDHYQRTADECRTCLGAGRAVTTHIDGDTAYLLPGWCVPCAGTGITRNLHAPELPHHPAIVHLAALRLAGYLATLAGRDLHEVDEAPLIEVVRAAAAAADAVRWAGEQEAVVCELPCSNCSRHARKEGSLCTSCARYLQRTGRARPPHLWLAS